MTIAFDAATAIANGTGDLSGTHTPVGTPRGVFVTLTFAGAAMQDFDAVEVLYGGVPMWHCTRAAVNGGEDAAAEIYFLGSGIPTGAQTVTVTDGGLWAHTRYVDCVTVTAADDLNWIEAATTSVGGDPATTGTDITPSSGTPAGNFYSVAAFGTGYGVPPTIVTSGFTDVRSTDHGSYCTRVVRDDTERSSGDGVCNATVGVTDEFVGVICTVEEGTIDVPPVQVVGHLSSLATGENGGPATCDLTLITGLLEDDVVIAWVSGDDTPGQVSIDTAGYTEILEVNASTADSNLRVYWKAMGATVDTVVTTNTADANTAIVCGCYVLRGASTSAPIDNSSSATANAAAAPNCPSITPTVDNCTIIFIGAGNENMNGFDAPYITEGIYHDHFYSNANDIRDAFALAGVYYQGTAAALDPPVFHTNRPAKVAWTAASIAVTASAAATPSGAVTQTWATVKSQVVTAGSEVNNNIAQTWATAKSQVVNVTANKAVGNVTQTWASSKSQVANANAALSGGSGRTRTFTGAGI